jgi:hypothetical protein
MTDTIEITMLKTKPSLRTIGWGLFGALLFGTFTYQVSSIVWTVSEGTNDIIDMIIGVVILGMFIFFTIGSLWTFLSIKTIVLTNKNLIIKRPFLLLKNTVPIENIRKITESKYKINPKVRGSNYEIYKGKQILIECFNGKSILLNSFEISDYYLFVSKLKKLKSDKINNFNENNENLKNDNQGIGWLLFVILFTIGLIYSIIKLKL